MGRRQRRGRAMEPVPGGGGHGAAPQAYTADERHETAKMAVKSLGLTMPTLVDDMSDSTSLAYGAWPDRIFVVDIDGRVFAAGEPGPKGFLPDELEAALNRLPAPIPRTPSTKESVPVATDEPALALPLP